MELNPDSIALVSLAKESLHLFNVDFICICTPFFFYDVGGSLKLNSTNLIN